VDRVLDTMIEAARAGGAIARECFTRGFAVSIKSDGSPVTEADREAEGAIARVLGSAFPAHGWLGEETGGRGPDDRRFIVDPIDGTRNFVAGIPFWATLIALEEAGVATAGVVFQPLTGDLHVARRGGGAFLNGRPIRVSTMDALSGGALLHGSLDVIRRAGIWDGFLRLVDATPYQRGFGDFLSFTTVAEGKGEVALTPNVKPWDLAALRLLIEEAGGAFSDFEGKPTIYSGTAFATNGVLHATALTRFRGDRP
jgi:histidinol-phosphatase